MVQSSSTLSTVLAIFDCLRCNFFTCNRFGLDELRRFVLTVKKNYRDVPYHNWTHAFAVAHSMYLVIRSGNDKFTALEVGEGTILFTTRVLTKLIDFCVW